MKRTYMKFNAKASTRSAMRSYLSLVFATIVIVSLISPIADAKNFIIENNAGTDIFVVNGSSNRVGIGLINPTYPLDISGDFRFSGTLQGGTVPLARLAAGSSANIIVADGTGAATWRTLVGDATINNTGGLLISNGAITTVKLADGSVTAVKIASSQINTTHILNGTITNADLVSNLDLGWGNLTSYPSDCGTGQVVKGVGDTLTCVPDTGITAAPGNGTLNHIPKWITSTTLGDSRIVEDATTLNIDNGAIYLDSNNNVGIGTTSPGTNARLNVSGNIFASQNVTAQYFLGDGSQLTNINLSGVPGAESDTLDTVTDRGATTTNAIQVGALNATGAINFSTLTANRLVTTTTGSILSTSISSLNVADSVTDETGSSALVFNSSPTIGTPRIATIYGGTAASSTLILRSTTAAGTSDAIIFGVGNNGGTEAIRIISNGNIGIGTSSPGTAKLNVTGSIYGSNGLTVNSGTITLPNAQINNSELEHSSLTVSAGNGLVNGGTVSLGGSTTLNVGAGTGIISNADDVSIDTTIVPRKNEQETITQRWTFSNDIRVEGNLIVIGNISNADVTNLNVNGSLYPSQGFDNYFDIGSSTRRWRSGYFSNNVFVNGNFVLTNATNFGGNVSGTYDNIQLAAGSVGPSQVIDNSLTSSDIDQDAITSSELASSGVSQGTYGNGTQVAVFTVDTDGRITSASNVSITGASPTGNAGGDLSGTYPNPDVKDNSHTHDAANITAGTLVADRGGTGISGAGGNSNRVLLTTNGNTWSAAQVNLTNMVTGILPIGNGGTGTSTVFTQGSIVFAGASGVYTNDSTNFFWDNTNDRLGIGTNTPSQKIEVNGNINISTSNGVIYIGGAYVQKVGNDLIISD